MTDFRLLIKILKKIRRLHFERNRYRLKSPETNLFSPHLKIGNVVLVNPCLFGKINLAPSASLPQLPYSLPERNADIACHPLYSGISL
ncbi:MAG TPA: hypothetical protein VK638_32320 [Edaphobacter sp.]|nr:hypothetical protein [Edaphobacter sp.]